MRSVWSPLNAWLLQSAGSFKTCGTRFVTINVTGMFSVWTASRQLSRPVSGVPHAGDMLIAGMNLQQSHREYAEFTIYCAKLRAKLCCLCKTQSLDSTPYRNLPVLALPQSKAQPPLCVYCRCKLNSAKDYHRLFL